MPVSMAGVKTKCGAVFVFVVISLVAFTKMYVDSETSKVLLTAMESKGNEVLEMGVPKSQELILINTKHYIDQRNNISRMLNLKQMKIGQMDCEVIYFVQHICKSKIKVLYVAHADFICTCTGTKR